jgi:xanthine dehydrogenase accessory factor
VSAALHDWLPALMRALQREPAIVRILLAEVRGSAPREPGSGMLVGAAGVEGTIGGGQLEWEAIGAARALLADSTVSARLQRMVLAADLGQCCGGVVTVWLERFTREHAAVLRAAADAAGGGRAVLISTLKGSATLHRVLRAPGGDGVADRLLRAPRVQALPRVNRTADGEISLLERLDDELPPLWLYGAGHVGQALSRMMAELPLRLTWIDSRAELLPSPAADTVRILHAADPVPSVAGAPAGAYFVVMTHSHPLDYALCRAILRRNDFAWLGLIGSLSKAARFRSRLARDGLGAEVIARLVCPIGIGGIASKWPAAIAVGVAAQLMQAISAAAGEEGGLGQEGGLRPASAIDAVCAPADCATCGSAGAQPRPASSP